MGRVTSLPGGVYFYRMQVYPANGGQGFVGLILMR
jgi:hypothetical protein